MAVSIGAGPGEHGAVSEGERRGVPWLRVTAGIVAALVVVAGIALARLDSETIPALQSHLTSDSVVRFPGRALSVAWPHDGEAAATVEGVGVIGSVGGPKPVPIASVAKIMTAYLTLRAHPLTVGAGGFRLTVTSADVADRKARLAQGQSTVAVAAGEVLSEYQLLEALLIPSANNVAAMLATYEAGSQGAFVTRMNAEAKALRMTNTRYTDASGFTDTTVSTAADQLRLAKVVMRNPVFAGIVDRPTVVLPVAGPVTNFNRLVGTNGFIGIKTGSDSQAGGCLAFADRRAIDGHTVTIVGVVLGEDRGQSNAQVIISAALAAATKLANSVASGLGVRTVVPAGRSVLDMTNADGHRVAVATAAPLEQLGWGGLRLRLSVRGIGSRHGLSAGQQVATVVLGGHLRAMAPARAVTSMPRLSLAWRVEHLF